MVNFARYPDILDFFRLISVIFQIATSLIPATVAGLAIPLMNKRWNRVVPTLLAAYGQVRPRI